MWCWCREQCLVNTDSCAILTGLYQRERCLWYHCDEKRTYSFLHMLHISFIFVSKSHMKKSKQSPQHAAPVCLYVMQKYPHLNCQGAFIYLFIFLHQTWIWQHHYPALPSLFFLCQSFLVRSPTVYSRVQACTPTWSRAHAIIFIFVVEI